MMEIESTILGRTDVRISRLGMGGCPLGGHGWGPTTERDSIQAVERAVELGVNFFDTADCYGLGRSEELLSQALGSRRHEVTIATKFGVRWDKQNRTWKDTSAQYLRQALTASLRRLRLDCIPLYYIHWPDEHTPIEETVGELIRCQEEGKIRWIGLSNFSANTLNSLGPIAEIASIQLQMSLVDQQAALELFEATPNLTTTLVTWGSLAQGLLTGKYDSKTSFTEGDRRNRHENFEGAKFATNLRIVQAVRDVAARLGKTPAQVAIRWLLDTPGVGCVLFGAKNPAQVADNHGALGWNLPEREYSELNTASQQLSTLAA